jgi:hypothetical protein
MGTFLEGRLGLKPKIVASSSLSRDFPAPSKYRSAQNNRRRYRFTGSFAI